MIPDFANHDRFEAISRASPVGIFHADLDANVDYTNPRLREMWELDHDAMRGRGWLTRLHPDDAAALLAGWTAANTAGREYAQQFRIVLPDGRVRWVHGRSAIIHDAAGHPTHTVGTVEDVTVQHEGAERAHGLLAISAALARALTAADVADAVATHAAPVVGASSSMVMLLQREEPMLDRVGGGGLPPELAGLWERVPLDAPLPGPEAIVGASPVLLRSPAEMAVRFPEAEGNWRRIGARALAVFPMVVDGEALGAIAFRFDRPRAFGADDLAFLGAVVQQCAVALGRARLFEDVRCAREEADEANRAKSDFLARMSHELRTPLNAIAGHLQLIEMGLHGPVTSAQQDALARVGRAQRYLLGLINDVLNLTRLETGRVEYTLRPVLLADALADVRPMVEPQLAAKRLTFATQLPEDDGDAPILVWADREKLVQVLLNLLSNAVKFTPEGGRVTLTLAPDAGAHGVDAFLAVTDTGVGIPFDRQDAVFEPFVQVHAGLTRTHQGSGLGLTISRDLVRGMGGELTVQSAPGHGSTFTIRLRRALTAAGEATDRRTRQYRRTGTERRSGIDRRTDHEEHAITDEHA